MFPKVETLRSGQSVICIPIGIGPKKEQSVFVYDGQNCSNFIGELYDKVPEGVTAQTFIQTKAAKDNLVASRVEGSQNVFSLMGQDPP